MKVQSESAFSRYQKRRLEGSWASGFGFASINSSRFAVSNSSEGRKSENVPGLSEKGLESVDQQQNIQESQVLGLESLQSLSDSHAILEGEAVPPIYIRMWRGPKSFIQLPPINFEKIFPKDMPATVDGVFCGSQDSLQLAPLILPEFFFELTSRDVAGLGYPKRFAEMRNDGDHHRESTKEVFGTILNSAQNRELVAGSQPSVSPFSYPSDRTSQDAAQPGTGYRSMKKMALKDRSSQRRTPHMISHRQRWGLAEWPTARDEVEARLQRRRQQVREALRRHRAKKQQQH